LPVAAGPARSKARAKTVKAAPDEAAAQDGPPAAPKAAGEAAEDGRGRGPWTDEEEKLFLEGLELYGRDWGKVRSTNHDASARVQL